MLNPLIVTESTPKLALLLNYSVGFQMTGTQLGTTVSWLSFYGTYFLIVCELIGTLRSKYLIKKIRKSNLPKKCTRIEIYLSLFEHFRQNVDGEKSQKWLICDGSVDYKWAENLESFMTSGVLTIHSGEELTISPHTKLIFETTHLRDVSI